MNLYVIAIAVSMSVGMLAAGILADSKYKSKEKAACESSLPRDIECTWAPPELYKKKINND